MSQFKRARRPVSEVTMAILEKRLQVLSSAEQYAGMSTDII